MSKKLWVFENKKTDTRIGRFDITNVLIKSRLLMSGIALLLSMGPSNPQQKTTAVNYSEYMPKANGKDDSKENPHAWCQELNNWLYDQELVEFISKTLPFIKIEEINIRDSEEYNRTFCNGISSSLLAQYNPSKNIVLVRIIKLPKNAFSNNAKASQIEQESFYNLRKFIGYLNY
ncbi:MAG: hypothetical protein LBF37_02825 [Rickettsiales bacterium]|jgi:hypothetical protein|nr:hypothetical protein [Rickettsiales bacterium]